MDRSHHALLPSHRLVVINELIYLHGSEFQSRINSGFPSLCWSNPNCSSIPSHPMPFCKNARMPSWILPPSCLSGLLVSWSLVIVVEQKGMKTIRAIGQDAKRVLWQEGVGPGVTGGHGREGLRGSESPEKFWWHLSFCNVLVLLTFQSRWHFCFGDISIVYCILSTLYCWHFFKKVFGPFETFWDSFSY